MSASATAVRREMAANQAPVPWVLDFAGLEALVVALRKRGYRVAAPVTRHGAVALEEVESAAALPRGVTDVQEPGRYRLEPADEDALFPVLHGAQTWKRFLLPPRHTLLVSHRNGGDVVHEDPPPRGAPWAFLGLRPCDLAGILRLDRILIEGPYPDVFYRSQRVDAFFVVVACESPGETCFCASMGTGPAPRDGYDLALAELGGARLLAEAGTERGAALLEELPKSAATPDDVVRAAERRVRAAAAMGRTLDPVPLASALPAAAESPRWDQIGKRCLSCGSCTMVCPTCFCMTVDDTTDLSGTRAERRRSWDSCFTLDFTHLHGGSVRRSPGARYRQWLTHKLSGWVAQFGTPGCVGCGRCVTWCPVGIDITSEAAAVVNAAAETRPGRTA